MSSDEREIPPNVQKLINEWRAEAELALETSEGHAWLPFWYTLHRLQRKTDELMQQDVDKNARLPIRSETQDKIAGTFTVPDTIADLPDEED